MASWACFQKFDGRIKRVFSNLGALVHRSLIAEFDQDQDTARYVGLLLAPAESFFCSSDRKKRSYYAV